MTDDPNMVRGVTTRRILGNLIVRYREVAVFPSRCLFTGIPVEGLTEMKIRRPGGIAAHMLKTECTVHLKMPVSEAWLNHRRDFSKLCGYWVGVAGLVISSFAAILLKFVDLASEAREVFIFALVFGVVGSLSGFVWRFLNNPDPTLIFTYVDDEQFVLTGIHRQFLALVPDEPKESAVK